MPFKMTSMNQGASAPRRVVTERMSDVALIRTKVVDLQEQLRFANDHLRRAYLGTAFSSLPRLFDAIRLAHDISQETDNAWTSAYTENMTSLSIDRVVKKLELEKIRTALEAEKVNLRDVESRALEAKKVLSAARNSYGVQSPMTGEDETAQLLPPPPLLPEEQNVQMKSVARDEAFAKQRNQQMTRIQGQVHDVNEFMRDLATMVVEQGAQIESVETTALQSKLHVREAEEELKEVFHKKSTSLHSSLRCLLLTTIFVLAIILSYHHQFNWSYHHQFNWHSWRPASWRPVPAIVRHHWPLEGAD